MLDVTTVLVSFNTAKLLNPCLDRLAIALKGVQNEIIVVDNASSDDSVAVLRREYPECKLIVNTVNVGFGRANNQALEHIKSRYVLLLNTDAFVEPDALHKTLAYMDANPDCGILGVRLVGRDNVIQPCARYFPTVKSLFLHRTGLRKFFPNVRYVDDAEQSLDVVHECDWVVGCYYLVRREVIDSIGLFDPRYFLYYEEVDHCLAAKKAGWKVVFFPLTTVVHIGGESAKSVGQVSRTGSQLESMQLESEFMYFRKNHGLATVVGVFLSVFVGDFLNIIRNAAKFRRPVGLSVFLDRSKLMIRILAKTGMGQRPTR